MSVTNERRLALQSDSDLLDWTKVPAHYVNAFFGKPDHKNIYLVALLCIRNAINKTNIRQHLLKFYDEQPLSEHHSRELADACTTILSDKGTNFYGYNVESGQLLFGNGDVWEHNRRRPRMISSRYDRPVRTVERSTTSDVAMLEVAWRSQEAAVAEEDAARQAFRQQAITTETLIRLSDVYY